MPLHLSNSPKTQPSKKRYFAYLMGASCLILLLLLGILQCLFPLKVSVDYSPIITDQKGTILHAFLNKGDKWRMMTELEEITPELQKAILHKEDKYFYYHFGINPLAIFRAAFNNIWKGRRTSGASTVTMQVIRLLYPKKRSYKNKLKEMWQAMQLELQLSKDEILQLYLNLVPYGSNIEGVKSAAVLYFDKTPSHLSLAEITALTIIPNRPTSLRLGKSNDRIVKERNRWLRQFDKDGLFDATAIADALEEPLTAKRRAAPKIAPHFAYRMKKAFPQQPIIKTNLNFNHQVKVEKLVSNYINRLYHQRIRNAAVLVINNQTDAVEAYIGSADFNNSEDAGQVDGIKSIRSPGSTLKPFLYALAFDKGIVTPKTMISDVPVNFSGYSPLNYDKKYNGMVSMEYALAQSLNVPSVKVLSKLGSDFFVEQLVQAGFNQIKKDQKKLGLSVVLGGCGVRLEEVTNLYRSFANEGRYRKLAWLQKDTVTVEMPLVSESGAYMLTEVLTKLQRPDLPKQMESSKNLPKIAWKTGTSYGRRDAWSVGFNANYTIGVWVGNFSGEGVPDLTGSNTATPLLFQIFTSLDYGNKNDWFAAPQAIDYRWVCSKSGLPPNDYCQDQVMDVFLPMVSSNLRCTHLTTMYTHPEEHFSYCMSCLPEVGYKKKLYPLYEPEIVAFYEQENIHYEKIPPHNPDCGRVFTGRAPRIISPINGLEYLLDPTDNNQLMLSCNVSNDVKEVYWYINDSFYQQNEAGSNAFFVPKAGKNKVTCIDDKGRRKDVWVEVRYL